MVYKKYSKEFKEKIIKEYLSGKRTSVLTREYGINRSRIYHWRDQLEKYGTFPDGRGKAKGGGRPKLVNIDTSQMTKDEYIAYLEMENDILKYLASLKKKNQK